MSFLSVKSQLLQDMYALMNEISSFHPLCVYLPMAVTAYLEFYLWNESERIQTSAKHLGKATIWIAVVGLLFHTVCVLSAIASRVIFLSLAKSIKLKTTLSYKLVSGVSYSCIKFLAFLFVSSEHLLIVGKIVTAVYWICNPNVSLDAQISKSVFFSLAAVLCVDAVIGFIIAFVKIMYLRPLHASKQTFYARADGMFEVGYVFLVPVRMLIVILRGYSYNKGSVPGAAISEAWLIACNLTLLVFLFRSRPFFQSHLNKLYGSYLTFWIVISLVRIAQGMQPEGFPLRTALIISLPVYFMVQRFLNDFSRSDSSIGWSLGTLTSKLHEVEVGGRLLGDATIREKKGKKSSTDIFERFIRNKNVLSNEISGDNRKKKTDDQGSEEEDTENHAFFDKTTKNIRDNEIVRELAILAFEDAEQARPKDIYVLLLKVEWMISHFPSLAHLLLTLEKMSRLVTDFQSSYLYFYATKLVEEFFISYYLTGYVFRRTLVGSETSTQNTNQGQEAEVEGEIIITSNKTNQKLTSVLRHSSLDLAYVFYYKDKIQSLVKRINRYSAANIELLDMIKERTEDVRKVYRLIDKQSSQASLIESSFEDMNDLGGKMEFTHIVVYIYHLNFNVNMYESARAYLKQLVRRATALQQSQDHKSLSITNENLFAESFFVLVDSSRKSFGRVLDIYGNYHLFMDSHLDAIGKNYDIFLLPTVKEYHNTMLSHLYQSSLYQYRVVGGNQIGFIKLPQKNFVAFATVVIKILPYSTNDFKYLAGVKPLLSASEDKYFILLDNELKVEGYSYNFMQLLPESFLLIGSKVNQMSSMVGKAISNIREAKINFHRPSLGTPLRQKAYSIASLSVSQSHLDEHRSNKRLPFISNIANMPNNNDLSEAPTVLEDDIKFIDSQGKVKTRRFIITIKWKEFLLAGGGYWYLMLVLKEDAQERGKTRRRSSDVDSDGSGNQTFKPAQKTQSFIRDDSSPPQSENEAFEASEGMEKEEPEVLGEVPNLPYQGSTFKNVFKSPTISQGNEPQIRHSRLGQSSMAHSSITIPEKQTTTLHWLTNKPTEANLKTYTDTQELGSIDVHIKDRQNITNQALQDASSMAPVSENITNPRTNYNKMPSIYHGLTPKKQANQIDATSRKTLLNQAIGSQHVIKLETIGEISNFERANSQANRSELMVKGSDNVSNTNYSQHLRASKLNKEYISYEQAIKKKPFNIINLLLLCSLVLLLVAFWVGAKVKHDSHDSRVKELVKIADFIINYSLFIDNAAQTYLLVLRKIGTNLGYYKRDRLQTIKSRLDPNSAFAHTEDYHRLDDYVEYLEWRSNASFYRLINQYNQMSKNLELMPSALEYILTTNMTMRRLDFEGNLTDTPIPYYRAFMGDISSHLAKLLQHPIEYFDLDFNKSSEYSLIVHNYAGNLQPQLVSLYEHIRGELHLYISRYFESIKLVSFTTLGVFVLVLVIRLVLLFLQFKSMNGILYSIYSCRESEMDQRQKLMGRVKAICQTYQEENYFFVDKIRESDLDHAELAERMSFKAAILTKQKFFLFGTTVTTVLSFLLQIGLILVVAFSGFRFSTNSATLLEFFGRYTLSLEASMVFNNIRVGVISNIFFSEYMQENIMSKPDFDRYMHSMTEKISDLTTKHLKLIDKSRFGNSDIDDFFSHLYNSNMCLTGNDLPKYNELCTNLDNKVASEGYVQLYLRVSARVQLYADTYFSGDYSLSTGIAFLNEPSQVEYAYMHEVVYKTIYANVAISIYNYITEFAQNNLKDSTFIETLRTILLVSESLAFVWLAYSLYTSWYTIRFVYSLLPVSSVLHNMYIRTIFMNAFKLPKNYFA